ncbi:hypothetical protein MRB53_011112 [Persea americana]|uniref:Uncharacterized protein n=1 Tax=Persea americana TaxID=3435 RepID=A0ACC2LU10_PERAE|nr:hypothetical protein MRB53_011112 [Persea americana]
MRRTEESSLHLPFFKTAHLRRFGPLRGNLILGQRNLRITVVWRRTVINILKYYMEGEGEGAAIGIDLGTTYSCVAVWLSQHERVEIITNDQGNRTTPSYVAFTDTERLIGEAAKNQAPMNPINSVFVVFFPLGFASLRAQVLPTSDLVCLEIGSSTPQIYSVAASLNFPHLKFAPPCQLRSASPRARILQTSYLLCCKSRSNLPA